jgi:hypothetical protein
VAIQVDSEEEVEEDGEGGDEDDGVEDYRSVVSLDSIAENADFISLK